MLIALVMGFTSCKKDKNEADVTTVDGLTKTLTKGFWQELSYQYGTNGQTVQSKNYFAYSFKSGNKLATYYMKGQVSSDDAYFRAKMHDGRLILVIYYSKDKFDKDQYSDSDMYDVTMKDGNLQMFSRKYSDTYTYKNYSSIAATKDLPPST